MMETPFTEQAIPMVAVNADNKYVLTEQAIKFLRAIQGPIAVVSVAGLYRTGKSYLLNRVLLNRSNGFGVGPTVNPCTKGLWCWGTPIKGTSTDGEQVNIIVIDTEGIGALDEDQTHDTKIFTLAILASSCFIYNSVGSIDENAIQNLSLVVNLTKHIQLKKSSNYNDDGQDPDEIATYFPSFYWVVRDFSLQLQDAQGNSMNSKEYLEKALAPQNGFSDDVEEKNRIRRLLTAFFKDRDCFTMIRPLVDEQKLQLLDKLDYDELRPEFVDQAMKFRKRIITAIKVKTLQNQKLNGDMYCSMISSYVEAINDGAVPNIENAWNYMCEEQCRKSLDECYEVFMKELKDGLREFPKPEEEFNKVVNDAEEKSLEMFRGRALGDRASDVLKELKNRIREKISEIREENIKESNSQLRKYIIKYVTPLNKKLNSQEFKSFSEFEKEVNAVYERLLKEGPKLHNFRYVYLEAMRKLSAQGAEFLFKNFTKTQEKNNQLYKEKEKMLNLELQGLRGEKQSLRKKLNESTTTSDQIISELRFKLESLDNQLMMTARSKNDDEKRMQRELAAKQAELISVREAMEAKVKETFGKYEEVFKTYNAEKKEWEKEKALNDLKTKQQGIQIEELLKKEKTLENTLNFSKLEMSQQVREMTRGSEMEKMALKKQVDELTDANTLLNDQLSTLRDQTESMKDKLEKREKKMKEQAASKKADAEKLKNQLNQQKQKLKDEYQAYQMRAEKTISEFDSKFMQQQKAMKLLQDDFKKEKSAHLSTKEQYEQQINFMNETMQNLKTNNSELRAKIENMTVEYQNVLIQKMQEGDIKRLEQLKEDHNKEIEIIMRDTNSKLNQSALEIENMVKKHMQLEELKRMAEEKLDRETNTFNSTINQLREEIKHLKNLQKTIDAQKNMEMLNKEDYYERKLKELEIDFEAYKDTAHQDRNDYIRKSEETIAQIKNNFEIEKVNLEKRLASEKDKSERRYNQTVEDYERRIQEQVETLENDNQELREALNHLEDTFRVTTSELQHELDINRKRAETLEKSYNEIKQSLSQKETEFINKYDSLIKSSKEERSKFEVRIDELIKDNNTKDKALMTATHENDQLNSILGKKQTKILELEKEYMDQKTIMTAQIEKLQERVSKMEKEHYDKITTHVKENALMKQENEFNSSKIRELEKSIETMNALSEEKITTIKTEKDAELKAEREKFMTEKVELDKRIKELKTKVKEDETRIKILQDEKEKQNGVNEETIKFLKKKVEDIENEKSEQTKMLRTELSSLRVELSTMREVNEKKIKDLTEERDKFETAKFDINLQFEKEKSLLDQKVKFLESQKEQNKKDHDERVRKLQQQIVILQDSRVHEKSQFEKVHSGSLRDMEAKSRARIQELSDQVQKKTFEYDALVKEKETLRMTMTDKFNAAMLEKTSYIRQIQGKLTDLTDGKRRAEEEAERYKTERDQREMEYRRREATEKESFKAKYSQLETKQKESENLKTHIYFEYEKDKSKWKIEKENQLENINNLKETVAKLEKDRERYKSEAEKLKNEKKNANKTNTYVSGLKTYYEPSKVMMEESKNKENQNIQ